MPGLLGSDEQSTCDSFYRPRPLGGYGFSSFAIAVIRSCNKSAIGCWPGAEQQGGVQRWEMPAAGEQRYTYHPSRSLPGLLQQPQLTSLLGNDHSDRTVGGETTARRAVGVDQGGLHMHASETKIQTIIDSQRQYVIPLFQRPYSWDSRQWGALWNDLAELCDEEAPRNHFIGSIVTMPSRSVPEGVTKFILIDGQQRLTTLLLLLALLRDKARKQSGNLADKIDDVLLKNRHQDGADIYKLLPTQVDRAAFCAVMDSKQHAKDSPIIGAYEFFERKLRLSADFSLDKLYAVIRNHLVLVSIVLGQDDNPYLIFESLNFKGRPLTQADLIRNFFFMRIHVNLQEKVYAEHWKPMQDRLGENLTEYIRHFLMRDGKIVRQSDVYSVLKESVEGKQHDQIVAYLEEVARFSTFYARLLQPTEERTGRIAERLERLNRYEARTAYPFLLNVYRDYEEKKLSEPDFAAILDMLESFVIRRFICGVATSGLTKIFPALYGQAQRATSLMDGVRQVLRDKSFPRDQVFKEQFVTAKIYGGDRSPKARLILERLEMSFEHKEPVALGALTIEHVMPRTPNEWWRRHLGDEWEAIHEEWLDTIGNLTLTGYNSELSNSDFPTKQEQLQASHVELNRYFGTVKTWDEQAIQRRGENLAERALQIWSDFTHRERTAEGDLAGEEDVQEEVKVLVSRVIEQFGGEVEKLGNGARYMARMGNGQIINIKHSKRHSDYYWFGIHRSSWEDLTKANGTHIVFILRPDGYLTVPLDVVRQYLAEANFSPKSDGSVRHYHVLISPEPMLEFFHHGKPGRIPLKPYYTSFDG
jgi:uncharacterized protein with ParB-like and HNH nuclease domain